MNVAVLSDLGVDTSAVVKQKQTGLVDLSVLAFSALPPQSKVELAWQVSVNHSLGETEHTVTFTSRGHSVSVLCTSQGYRVPFYKETLLEPLQVIDLVSEDLAIGFHSLGVRAAIEEKLAEVAGTNVPVSTNLHGTSLVITAIFADKVNRRSVTAEITTFYGRHCESPFGDFHKGPEWFAKLLWKQILARLDGGVESLLARVQRAVPELVWALSDSECLGTRESDGELLVRVGISGNKVSA